MKNRRLIPVLALSGGLLFFYGTGFARLAEGVIVCVKASRMGNPVTGRAAARGELIRKDGTRTEVSLEVELDQIEGSKGAGCTGRITPDRDLLREVGDVGEGRLSVSGTQGEARTDLHQARVEDRITRDGTLQTFITVEFQYPAPRENPEIVEIPNGTSGGSSVVIAR